MKEVVRSRCCAYLFLFFGLVCMLCMLLCFFPSCCFSLLSLDPSFVRRIENWTMRTDTHNYTRSQKNNTERQREQNNPSAVHVCFPPHHANKQSKLYKAWLSIFLFVFLTPRCTVVSK
ncbi:MAG: hypothetical protein J3R72DRAFT_52464 [Linnemannia gamsii]|nr:MAG: hypothetical protein J3R72DRAFT_52464 [Linnemannia gamsii]